MRVLVACEFSGTVRDAFAALGWDAWSCDFLPSETPGNHVTGDCLPLCLSSNYYGWQSWDLLIAHPPCTYLCNSGVRWLHTESLRRQQMIESANFFKAIMNSPIPRICIENPIPHKYALDIIGRKYDQIIQPWQHGHGETKATCLWLKNLPPLMPTHVDNDLFEPPTPPEREQRIWKLPPSADRWKERSRTYPGIAGAMAKQWTQYLQPKLLASLSHEELHRRIWEFHRQQNQ